MGGGGVLRFGSLLGLIRLELRTGIAEVPDPETSKDDSQVNP